MPKLKLAFFIISGLVLFAALSVTAAASDKLAVKAGRIITVAGEEIENGTVLIENGKIKAVGKDIKIPYDYWVIDEPDCVVFPGMVECFTSRGLDIPNENIPVAPWLDVVDAIDPSSVYFENALRDGITTLFISQGSNTVIGGVARAVKPIGMTPHEMTVKPDTGIIISLSPKYGYDRMTQMTKLRDTFRELEVYLDNLAEFKYEEKLKKDKKKIDVSPDEAVKRGKSLVKDEDIDFKHLNLVRMLRGELKPILHCAVPLDVKHAVDLAKEHGFFDNAIFVLANPCYKAARLLKGVKRPVILSPEMTLVETDPMTGDETEIFVPKVYFNEDIPFAVRSNPGSNFGSRYLWYQAARLIRNKIPKDAAIKSITTLAAMAVGIEDRVGSLKPGLDGNLLILSGDPIDLGTWVEKVIIEGTLVYERSKDKRLWELISGKAPSPEKEGEGEKSESKSKNEEK